jgi:hypothetical protein
MREGQMEDCIDDDVLQWYRQFTHGPSEARDHTTPNFFTQVDEKEIAEFEKQFGSIIPKSYTLFLKMIGDGRLTQDKNGAFSDGYENSFLDVSEISEIIQKKTYEWSIYEDFISDDEIPFFYIGNNSVLVFRKNEGSKVYFPYLDSVYAENFGEFLRKLMNNINFYNEI